MIKGNKKINLTADAILEKISDYDVFRFYMPDKSWKLNHVTYSPFRKENHPSFLISNRNGFISFIDFADTNLRGNCFHFVKMLFNLPTHDDVLRMIDRDFDLGITSGESKEDYKQIISQYKQPEIVKRSALIQAVTRKFTNKELEYWNKYHQSIDDLKANNVYAIKKVYLNKQLFYISDSELTFGYLYDGHWKIYRPYGDKKNKWIPNNVPITAMDGKADIVDCPVAFINKSKKDYMVMKKIFPCSCAVQNEGIACFSQENVDYLKANSQKQILSFDSDVTGVQNSQQITKLFNFGYANVPRKYLTEGIKDWADLGRKHGMGVIEDYLKKKGLI
jgi:DNA primase